MLVLYEVVKYLCLEMGICVININEIMPQGLSDDRSFRPLPNAHNMETVYPITRAIMLLIWIWWKMNNAFMKIQPRITLFPSCYLWKENNSVANQLENMDYYWWYILCQVSVSESANFVKTRLFGIGKYSKLGRTLYDWNTVEKDVKSHVIHPSISQ